ncbi:MAG: iron uptake transporter permease EfeU [Candidatus Nanopelagicales bacterium]
MFGNFLIGLREGLEAAIVVSIIVGYAVRTDRRELLPRIWTGVGLAIALSVTVGAVLTFGSRGLSFEAQEAIGGTLSILAVALVTTMILWMAANARTLRDRLHSEVDTASDRGGLALVLMAFLAVAREGLETALFLWSAVQAAGGGWAPVVGAAAGLGVAVGIGRLLYSGVLRMNLAAFFKWTGAALILVAAGVLAYGVHDLQEAGILPGLNNLAFDISHTLAPGGVTATLVKGTLNLSPAMTSLEVTVWVAYVVMVGFFFFRTLRRAGGARRVAPAAAPATTEVVR